MPTQRYEGLDRRKLRKNRLEKNSFHRLDVRAQGLDEMVAFHRLTEYLFTAGIKILYIDGTKTTRARLAQFSDISFVHARVPKIELLWSRDELSIDRALIIFVKQGSIEFEPVSKIVTPTQGVHLVLPGTQPVKLFSRFQENELVYFSFPAKYIWAVFQSVDNLDANEHIDFMQFKPIISFAQSFCALTPSRDLDMVPLETAAQEVLRSALRLLGAPAASEVSSLYTKAIECILDNYKYPSFGVQSLAGKLGVSTRKLQHCFSQQGTTVSGTIREIRASAALQLRSENPKLSRNELTQLTGFGSIYSLDRALKKQETNILPQRGATRGK